ncbi:gp16 family protein [Methylobacillus flagellatus]|uniref:Mu-like prophage protein gp16 n=1 Tax=Methylobacillus flagellatus (strain ATCC 51484 / DSM 6875 / VKM B-1610 / KT) TaxID=265072 RepID=Q1GXP6_METFK|nr:regulatory protein GemA [Methylobacillus flagellatus]ABE50991.1 protein of unknown function DUF1018 [Methylobacillus flagellatus KT]
MKPNYNRNNALAKIHIAKKELGLDDDTYELILSNLCKGKTSAADLDWLELQKVLKHFESKGWISKPAKKARTTTTMKRDSDEVALIRALWLNLHKLGAVKNPSEQAIAAFTKRQYGVGHHKWLDKNQATHMAEALKSWISRVTK